MSIDNNKFVYSTAVLLLISAFTIPHIIYDDNVAYPVIFSIGALCAGIIGICGKVAILKYMPFFIGFSLLMINESNSLATILFVSIGVTILEVLFARNKSCFYPKYFTAQKAIEDTKFADHQARIANGFAENYKHSTLTIIKIVFLCVQYIATFIMVYALSNSSSILVGISIYLFILGYLILADGFAYAIAYSLCALPIIPLMMIYERLYENVSQALFILFIAISIMVYIMLVSRLASKITNRHTTNIQFKKIDDIYLSLHPNLFYSIPVWDIKYANKVTFAYSENDNKIKNIEEIIYSLYRFCNFFNYIYGYGIIKGSSGKILVYSKNKNPLLLRAFFAFHTLKNSEISCYDDESFSSCKEFISLSRQELTRRHISNFVKLLGFSDYVLSKEHRVKYTFLFLCEDDMNGFIRELNDNGIECKKIETIFNETTGQIFFNADAIILSSLGFDRSYFNALKLTEFAEKHNGMFKAIGL